jgi:SAM-dependent methyltransferase
MVRYGGYSEREFIAKYYDYLPVVSGRRDVEFFLAYARAAGGPVLELGCGTGRVLIPVAAEGCRIVGLDVSELMLKQCRAKTQSQPREVQERIRLVQGDMTNFDLGEVFHLVTLPFRPFQHLLSVSEQLACLGCVCRHLVPGGKLILDLFHTDARRMHDPVFRQESSPHPDVTLPDGTRVRLAERIAAFHLAEQYNEVELIYYVTHPDGQSERLVNAFPVRYFFRYEVEHLLVRSGFRVAELFGNYDKSPLQDDSPEMIFVAERS